MFLSCYDAIMASSVLADKKERIGLIPSARKVKQAEVGKRRSVPRGCSDEISGNLGDAGGGGCGLVLGNRR
jgi:hypothetical protein